MPNEEVPGYIKRPTSPTFPPNKDWVKPPEDLSPPARRNLQEEIDYLKNKKVDIGRLKKRGVVSDEGIKEKRERSKRLSEPSLKEKKELRKEADKVYELAAAWKSMSPERRKGLPILTIDNMEEFTKGLPSGDRLKKAYTIYVKEENKIVQKLKGAYKRIIKNREKDKVKDPRKDIEWEEYKIDQLFEQMRKHKVSPEKYLKHKIKGKTVMILNPDYTPYQMYTAAVSEFYELKQVKFFVRELKNRKYKMNFNDKKLTGRLVVIDDPFDSKSPTRQILPELEDDEHREYRNKEWFKELERQEELEKNGELDLKKEEVVLKQAKIALSEFNKLGTNLLNRSAKGEHEKERKILQDAVNEMDQQVKGMRRIEKQMRDGPESPTFAPPPGSYSPLWKPEPPDYSPGKKPPSPRGFLYRDGTEPPIRPTDDEILEQTEIPERDSDIEIDMFKEDEPELFADAEAEKDEDEDIKIEPTKEEIQEEYEIESNIFVKDKLFIFLLEEKGQKKELFLKCIREDDENYYFIDLDSEEEVAFTKDPYNFIELDTTNYFILDIVELESEKSEPTEEELYRQTKDNYLLDLEEKIDIEKEFTDIEKLDSFVSETISLNNAQSSEFKKKKILRMATVYIDMLNENYIQGKPIYIKNKQNYHPMVDNENTANWIIPVSVFRNKDYNNPSEGELTQLEEVEREEQYFKNRDRTFLENHLDLHNLKNPREISTNVGVVKEDNYKEIQVEKNEDPVKLQKSYNCALLNPPELHRFKGTDYTVAFNSIKNSTKMRYDSVKYTRMIPSDPVNISGVCILPQNYNFQISFDEKNISLETKTRLRKVNEYTTLFNDVVSDIETIKVSKEPEEIEIAEGQDWADVADQVDEQERIMTVDRNYPKIYLFEENQYTQEELINEMKRVYPDIFEILNKDYIYSIKDVNKILLLYNITFEDLSTTDSNKVLRVIKDNLSDAPKPKKRKREKKKKLTEYEIRDYIFSIEHEERKLELLKRFIKTYCRTALRKQEVGSHYYLKDSEKFSYRIMCRHWDHILNFDEQKLKRDFANNLPIDGNFVCKFCNQVLFEEKESMNLGFASGEEGVQLRQVEVLEREETIQLEGEYLDIKRIEDLLGIELKSRERDIVFNVIKTSYLGTLSIKRLGSKKAFIKKDPVIEELQNSIDSIKKDKTKKKEKEELKVKLLKEKERVSVEIDLVSKIVSITLLVFIILHTAIPDYDFGNHNIFNETDLKITFDLKTDAGINLLLYILDRIKVYYNEGEFKLLQKETFDVDQIKKLYKFISNCDILEQKIKDKDIYNKNSKIQNVQSIEWGSYRPHTENGFIVDINNSVKSSIDQLTLLKRLNSPLYQNICFMDSIEKDTDKEYDSSTQGPFIFQCFNKEDTLKKYALKDFEVDTELDPDVSLRVIKKLNKDLKRLPESLLLRCSLEVETFSLERFMDKDKDKDKETIKLESEEVYQLFIEYKNLVKPSDLKEDGETLNKSQIELWSFKSRFMKYLGETNDSIREIFPSEVFDNDNDDALNIAVENLLEKTNEMLPTLEKSLDLSMLEKLYKYEPIHLPKFSLQLAKEETLELTLLEQKNMIQCGLGGIQSALSMICGKSTEDMEVPQEWKLEKDRKRVFTEWKKGMDHKIQILGKDISPFGKFRKFWDETEPSVKTIFSELFIHLNSKLQAVHLLVGSDSQTGFSAEVSLLVTRYLFYSCFYELIEFTDCLEESKGCTGNPIFDGLEFKTGENKSLMKEFTQVLLEELYKSDILYKKQVSELTEILAKNREAEKQDLLQYGRSEVNDLEKELNEQFSRIGINRRLDEYSHARGDSVYTTEDSNSIQQQEQHNYEQEQATAEYQANDVTDDAYYHDQQNSDDIDDS